MNLRSAIKFLKSIPNINFGGCGIAALALLRMMNDDSVEIRFLYRNYGDRSFEMNMKILNDDSSEKPCAAEHIMLFRKGKYFDSDGMCDKRIIDTIYNFRLVVDESFLVKAINNRNKWLRRFSRKHVTKIEKRLSVNLNDIAV